MFKQAATEMDWMVTICKQHTGVSTNQPGQFSTVVQKDSIQSTCSMALQQNSCAATSHSSLCALYRPCTPAAGGVVWTSSVLTPIEGNAHT